MNLVPLLNRGELEAVSFGFWISPLEEIQPRVVYTRGGTRIRFTDFERGARCHECGLDYVHPQFRQVSTFVSKVFQFKPWDPELPTRQDLEELRTAMVLRDLILHAEQHGWTSEEAPPFIILL